MATILSYNFDSDAETDVDDLDFIDTGSNEDRSDSSVQEGLNWNGKNISCSTGTFYIALQLECTHTIPQTHPAQTTSLHIG
jgi:hypothetical protein